MDLVNRLNFLQEKIATAAQKANRTIGDITVVYITKRAKLEDVLQLINLGADNLGENRIQEAEKKFGYLESHLTEKVWSGMKRHMVGHLQTNKIKRALRLFDMIQSIDSSRLAELINQQAVNEDMRIEILAQINIAGEPSKFGVCVERAHELISKLSTFSHIQLRGIMGIAPFIQPDKTRPYFRQLRKLYDSLNKYLCTNNYSSLSVLSMGMSNDYEIAIEEGSTMVRIGRAIFGG